MNCQHDYAIISIFYNNGKGKTLDAVIRNGIILMDTISKRENLSNEMRIYCYACETEWSYADYHTATEPKLTLLRLVREAYGLKDEPEPCQHTQNLEISINELLIHTFTIKDGEIAGAETDDQNYTEELWGKCLDCGEKLEYERNIPQHIDDYATEGMTIVLKNR